MPGGTRARRAGTLAAVASPMQAPLRIASAAAAALDTSRIERAPHGDGHPGRSSRSRAAMLVTTLAFPGSVTPFDSSNRSTVSS